MLLVHDGSYHQNTEITINPFHGGSGYYSGNLTEKECGMGYTILNMVVPSNPLPASPTKRWGPVR